VFIFAPGTLANTAFSKLGTSTAIPIPGSFSTMSERLVLVLLVCALATLTGVLVAAAAGYVARRDHASYPAALTRAAVAFTATLTLAATVTAALSCVLHQ
jgi:hypothetical protein